MTRATYLRWIAAAVAVFVIAVVGYAVIDRPSDSSIAGASPTPSSSPSGSTGDAGDPIPPELIARWMGGHRAVVDGNRGTTIVLTKDSFVLTPSDQADFIDLLNSSAWIIDDGELRLELIATGSSACSKGDAGLYSYSLSPSGRTLTVSGERDDCATRLAAVPGVWWQMGCKTDGFCLGDLDAGTYQSQYIVPRLDPGEGWRSDFGALTYTVPDGWANSDDNGDRFHLTSSNNYAHVTSANHDPPSGIEVFTQPIAWFQGESCSGAPQKGVERTVADEMAWVRQVPGLVTTQPTAVTIDGYQGQWIDLSRDPAETSACDRLEFLITSGIYGTDGSMINKGGTLGMFRGERKRLTLLDLGAGDLLGIVVFSTDPARFDALVGEAMPILESMKFK